MPTVEPTAAPVEQPSPIVPVLASALESNLTKSGLVFNVVSRTLGLNFRTTECFEGSVGYGYVKYTNDGSSCFYVFFDTKDFPLSNPNEQSEMYVVIIEKGANPNTDVEGEWSIAILDGSYLTNSAREQLRAFNENRVDSPEESLLLNEIVKMPKELEDWWIVQIYPLSNEQVEKLYNSDLLQIK
jgi:hypothetical protein